MGKGKADEGAIITVGKLREWWEAQGRSELEKPSDGKSEPLGDRLNVGSDRQHYLFKEEPHQNGCPWSSDLERPL